MKTNAALLFQQPGRWEVTEVDLDGPGEGEVLVEMVATGLCHSDEHMANGASDFNVFGGITPWCGGHEGAGVVREVGRGVRNLKVGDSVLTVFIPSCGRCRWCAEGKQNLCDSGANVMSGAQLDGVTYPMQYQGKPVGTGIGTFSEWQVYDETSLVKIDSSLPLDVVCIVACAVTTGWGSAVNAANAQPGGTVIVMGCGGVGMSAVQGASHAGATHVIAVDPVAFKRDTALTLGATAAFADMDQATEYAKSLTHGQGADATVITVGNVHGERVEEAFRSIRKAGTVVVTAQGSLAGDDVVRLNLTELGMYQKRIQGVIYGTGSPRRSMQRLIDLYQAGTLKLDEMVTTRYALKDINQGYQDMLDGKNIRGVVTF
ncbi:NDMA-dependent alcohol dehydrogenase [Dactylosporangium sp. NPDC051484]|uniref:NDMA-dependent alcohol dehydrogenase n=1 Tax=Dactylosporangium sp. NPDC051484 TaxID=3154942 RepID=UPI00344DF601